MVEQRLEARLARLVGELRTLFADDLGKLLDDGQPRIGERARPGLERYWPDGLPLPLTVAAALDAVDAGRQLVAEAVAGDIRAAVVALVDPIAQRWVLERPEVVDQWTWRNPPRDAADVGPSHGAESALALLRRLATMTAAGGERVLAADFRRFGWWDSALSQAQVAEWAGPRLDKAWRGREGEDVAWARRLDSPLWQPPELPSARLRAELAANGDFAQAIAVPRPDGLASALSPGSVALLYQLERRALAELPEPLDDAAWQAVQSWRSKAPGDAHNAAAEAALAELGDDETKGNADALRQLAAKLCDRCNSFADAVGPAPEMPEGGGPRVVDGMLALDDKLASWLKRVDAEDADKLRAASRQRLDDFNAGRIKAPELFKAWADGGAQRLHQLARVLWRTVVKERWRHGLTKRPALMRVVAVDTLLPLMSRQHTLPGLDDLAVRDHKGRELGRIATVDAATVEMVRAGLHHLGTVTGHRLVRLLVHRAHDQWVAGSRDPRVIFFEGGWSALAEALKVRTRDFTQLRELVEAGKHMTWTHKNSTFDGLWVGRYERGTRAGPGFVEIVAGTALLPNMAAIMAQEGGKTPAARVARRLVPELRHEPPVSVVRELDQGPAWTLHRALIVELVDRAEELHKEGAIHISDERWRELARDARFPLGPLPRLLESWRTSDGKAPALIAEPERGHFTLADDHKLEREFIEDGGRRRIDGRESASKKKANKARRRGRNTKD